MSGLDAPRDADGSGVGPLTEGCRALLLQAVEEGRQLSEADLDSLRSLAGSAAEHGIALRELLAECLGDAPTNWWERPGPPARPGTPVFSSAAAPLEVMREATMALAEGYESAQWAAIHREEAARGEFVDDLLHGQADLGSLAERADRFGIHLLGPHTVAVARAAAAFRADDQVTRHVEEGVATTRGTHDLFVTTRDGLLVCVVSGSDPERAVRHFATQIRRSGTRRSQIAVSNRRTGPTGIVRAYREARSTLDLAARLQLDTHVVHASDVLVFQVLGRDQAAITDLVGTVLGGLEHYRDGPEPLLKTLAAYFDSGCVNTVTARRLRVGVRTITYRIKRVHELTGYDPTDPKQRYTLHTAVLGAHLLNWPTHPLRSAD